MSKLPTFDSLIEQVRNEIRKKHGLAWYKRLFFWLLRNEKLWIFGQDGLCVSGLADLNSRNKAQWNLDFPAIFQKMVTASVIKRFLKSHSEVLPFGTKGKLDLLRGGLGELFPFP